MKAGQNDFQIFVIFNLYNFKQITKKKKEAN